MAGRVPGTGWLDMLKKIAQSNYVCGYTRDGFVVMWRENLSWEPGCGTVHELG